MSRPALLAAIEQLNHENPRQSWGWAELAARLGVSQVEVVALVFAHQAVGDIEDCLVLKRASPPFYTRREIDAASARGCIEGAQ